MKAAAALFLAHALACPAGDAPRFDSGDIRLLHTDGGTRAEYRYMKHGDRLRIERTGETRPPHPVNLLDLKERTLTILRPINSSHRTLPFSAWDTPAENPAGGGFPPGIPAMPDLPAAPGNPDAPGIPGVPGGVPIPPLPGLPDMDEPPKLTPGDETREIHGHACRKHTLILSRPRQKYTLWLAKDEGLFPFFLLQSDAPARPGPADPFAQWTVPLRKEGLFPFLATLHEIPFATDENDAEAPGMELARWEIVSITSKEGDKPDDGLFAIPEGYFRADP